MATGTAIPAQSGAPARHLHAGVNCVVAEVSISAAPSAGDIFLMAKVPNGATVLAIQRNFAAGTGNDFAAQIGIEGATGSLSAFGSATGAAGIAFLTKGLPYTVSLTDAAVPQYVNVKVHVATVTSASATGSLSLTVLLAEDVGRGL